MYDDIQGGVDDTSVSHAGGVSSQVAQMIRREYRDNSNNNNDNNTQNEDVNLT